MRRVVVIGGGVSGLAAAHRLVETRGDAQLEVLLLEASPRPGGTLRTERRDGFLLEAGPDAFLSDKPAALELARRIGLGPHIIGTNEAHRRSFVARGNRLHPTPEGFHLLAPASLWPFVTSGIFSWRGKARMALDLFLPRRRARDASDDESLADFVRRRLGREALERMAQPMVGGIYTADPELLSLRATMPRFLEMERAPRSLILALRRAARARAPQGHTDRRGGASGARYSLFLSFDSGMQTLTDALAARLPAGTLRLDTRAAALSFDPQAQQWLVRTHAGEELRAHGVVVALPAHAAARLLRDSDAELGRELAAIPYASTATVNLAYRREDVPHPLDGFGFVVPPPSAAPPSACSFSSVKFAGRAPDWCVCCAPSSRGAPARDVRVGRRAHTEAVRADLPNCSASRARPLHARRALAALDAAVSPRTLRASRASARRCTTSCPAPLRQRLRSAGVPDCVRGGSRRPTTRRVAAGS